MSLSKRLEPRYLPEGQGDVILLQGKFWSVRYAAFVHLCPVCHRQFLSARPHAITCGTNCRKIRSRSLSKEFHS
jgi:hypothetical protein